MTFWYSGFWATKGAEITHRRTYGHTTSRSHDRFRNRSLTSSGTNQRTKQPPRQTVGQKRERRCATLEVGHFLSQLLILSLSISVSVAEHDSLRRLRKHRRTSKEKDASQRLFPVLMRCQLWRVASPTAPRSRESRRRRATRATATFIQLSSCLCLCRSRPISW